MSGYQTAWNPDWSGASGQSIGFADEYPIEDRWGFTADEVHGQPYNPNGHNLNAQPGPELDVPVQIQDSLDFGQYYGGDGWVLDDIPFPSYAVNAGTAGHDTPIDAARAPRRDPAHGTDVYQENQPTGHGVDFYGQSIDTRDYAVWMGPQTGGRIPDAFPAQAREDVGNWPEPFAALTVAPQAPVVVDNEKIPMRRIKEDDRPVYLFTAQPAANIQPGGTQYLPTVASNRALRTIIPNPQMARTPVDPWVSIQDESASYSDQSPDVFGGMI